MTLHRDVALQKSYTVSGHRAVMLTRRGWTVSLFQVLVSGSTHKNLELAMQSAPYHVNPRQPRLSSAPVGLHECCYTLFQLL